MTDYKVITGGSWASTVEQGEEVEIVTAAYVIKGIIIAKMGSISVSDTPGDMGEWYQDTIRVTSYSNPLNTDEARRRSREYADAIEAGILWAFVSVDKVHHVYQVDLHPIAETRKTD